jgi:hypothetical protein
MVVPRIIVLFCFGTNSPLQMATIPATTDFCETAEGDPDEDRGSRKAALARFLKRASTGGPEEEEHRLAA